MAKGSLFRKTPFFWLYFVFGALGVTLGVFLLPIWNDTSVFWKGWGSIAVGFIMFAAVVLYIILFLARQFGKEKREIIRILVVVEIVVFALIALGCLLDEFKVINVGGPCVILGMAFWIRGVISAIKGYLYRHTHEERRYSVADFAVAIFLITFGTILMVRPLFTELHLIWLGSIAVILASVFIILIGIILIPDKKRKNGKN